MHGRLAGDKGTHKGRIIYLNNLIACQHTSTLRRSVLDNILYAKGIFPNDKLDTYT